MTCRRRITRKQACWWRTRNAHRRGKGRGRPRAQFSDTTFAKRMLLLRSVQVAADQREVDEVADADGQRNNAERRGGPGIVLVLDLRDKAERDDEADRAAGQQDARATRTRGLRELRFHGDADSLGNRRQSP